MAEKLLLYYKYVYEEKGLQGKFELAKETHTPSSEAAIELDTPEMIEQFKEAILTITGKPAPDL